MDDDPIAERVFEVDDGGQRVVLDDHHVDGVARLGVGARHDDRDRVADVRDLVDREREVLGRLHVRRHGPCARHRTPRVAEVGAAVRGDHAGHAERGRQVDAADVRVGVGAAHERDRQRAGDREVVGVLRLAGEERGIFLAEHPRADDARGRRLDRGHAFTAWPEAASTAFTMLW